MGTSRNDRKALNTFKNDDSAVDNYFNKTNRVVESQKHVNDEFQSADMELIMKRKRSIILTIATKTGIKEVDSWTKFNSWMLNSSIHKKALNAYNYDELDELNKQFRQLEINFNNSAAKTGTIAWHHSNRIPRSSEN